jgi:hypothetical protein
MSVEIRQTSLVTVYFTKKTGKITYILDKTMSNEKHIIAQIEAYIRQGGGEYSDWYIGLADNPIDPITEASRLNKVQNQRFTYIETVSHQAAKAAADYFLNVCGTDGDISDTDAIRSCRALYIYKKAANLLTSPEACPA